jgi:hypothetical protein
VSVLGFGGSEIGYGGASAATVDRILGGALDAGLNVIDTAECYDASEELIGRAVAHRRKDYHLLTKCGHSSGLEFADWTPALIEKSIERSLHRLRTGYLDLVQFHSPDEETLRRGDVTQVLERARDRGLTRHIGCSGDGAAALFAVHSGAFDTIQTSVNIADQKALELVIPAAIERGMGVIAKRPIANAAWLGRWPFVDAYARPYRRRLRKLGYDFLGRGANQSVEMALRFTLGVPGVHTAIVGTMKPARWEDNAALAAKGPLPPADYAAIRARWHQVAPPKWVGMR